MIRAEKFIRIVLLSEGGSKYTNDPNDAGGETKYGISKKAFPNVDIKNLTEADAISLYKKMYYDPCKCDSFNDELLALHVFDFGVNAGISRSIKTLQSVIGVKADGVIGKQTIEKANSNDYVKIYIDARKAFYYSIGVGSNKKFIKGWINRVSNLKV